MPPAAGLEGRRTEEGQLSQSWEDLVSIYWAWWSQGKEIWPLFSFLSYLSKCQGPLDVKTCRREREPRPTLQCKGPPPY